MYTQGSMDTSTLAFTVPALVSAVMSAVVSMSTYQIPAFTPSLSVNA